MICSTSGDYGDVIYELPTVKALGSTDLVLCPSNRTNQRMTEERACSLITLLETIPWLDCVCYDSDPVGTFLDDFRFTAGRHINLWDAVADHFHVARPKELWLTVPDPKKVAPAVFHRSPRYHQDDFPWMTVKEHYGNDAIFVGMKEEYHYFRQRFGEITYYPTKTFLELAQVVAGAEMFVGNQSSPMAVRIASGGALIQETYKGAQNCIWQRDNAFYWGISPGPFLHPNTKEGKRKATTMISRSNQVNTLREHLQRVKEALC